MPIAVLLYDMATESEEYEEAMLRGPKYRLAFGDLYQKVRSKLKYEDISDAEATVYETVRGWIAEACEEYEVDVP